MSPLDLETLHLDAGSHTSPDQGLCFNEAAAYFAGEPHSDHPACVSPYLRQFGMRLNDRVTDAQRQDLIRFIPLVVGTAGDGLDERRRWLAADHVTRVSAPKWLDRAGLTEHAAALRMVSEIVDIDSHLAAKPTIRAARDAAYELRRDRWQSIRVAVTAAVKKALEAEPVVAVDVAAAAAVVVAVAAAVVVDVDVAVAAAVAADVDVAVAAVVAADDRYWPVRRAVYDAVYTKLRALYGERYAQLAAESWQDALSLYERLISPVAS